MQRPVLIAVRGLDAVGTGRQVELLATGLAAAGRHVHVAITTTGGSMADRLAAAGIAVHRVGRRPVPDLATLVGLAGLVRHVGATTLVAFGRRQVGLAAAVRLVMPRLRTVASVSRPVSRRVAWRLARMDRLVAASPQAAESCARLGLPASRIATVLPGSAALPARGTDREAIARHYGLDPRAEWTLCVAPLVAESRLERLLWGIDQLGVVRTGVEHLLVGSGPMLARVGRRARVQELAERLFVTESCAELPSLLDEVKLVWQPGPAAFGGAILDAMARGVPVVAVEGAAPPGMIESPTSGWVVPSLPESELPRRAFNLLEDAELARRTGEAGRTRAAERFPAGPMVAGFAAVLDSLA
jgi:glycosyltransferase involved in cell wall biosynthesis